MRKAKLVQRNTRGGGETGRSEGKRCLASSWWRSRARKQLRSIPSRPRSNPCLTEPSDIVRSYFKPLGSGVVFMQQSITETGTYKSPSSSNNWDLCAALWPPTSYSILTRAARSKSQRAECMSVTDPHCPSLPHSQSTEKKGTHLPLLQG